MLLTIENRIFKKRPSAPASLRLLQSAIASAADKLVVTLPRQSEQIRSRLLALVSSLNGDEATDHNAAAREFESILCDYQVAEQDVQQKREQALIDSIDVLAGILEDLTNGQRKQSEDLAALMRSVQLAADAECLNTFRQNLSAEATKLHASLEAWERDATRVEADLARHIRFLRACLGEMKGIGSEDALTGLTNRRRAEAELERHQSEYAVFSILFLGIRNLDVVNYSFGRAAGDQLLRMFAARLRTLTKPSEMICRWGGKEFLIVLKSSLPRARARSEELKEALNIPFALDTRSGLVSVSTENLFGAAEYCTGDCIDDLVARAHADMHTHDSDSSCAANDEPTQQSVR
jgi:diguanylate cyclase (GGDEF)-like protein